MGGMTTVRVWIDGMVDLEIEGPLTHAKVSSETKKALLETDVKDVEIYNWQEKKEEA